MFGTIVSRENRMEEPYQEDERFVGDRCDDHDHYVVDHIQLCNLRSYSGGD
jgi:hypothetical protein